MKIYKRNQGRWTRGISALVVMVFGGWGALSLYQTLSAKISSMAASVLIPLAVWAALGFLVYKVFNGIKTADFLIATEGEMKKVSWSTKAEVVGSTKVVIVTTFIMAALLFLVDLMFATMFKLMGITG